MAQGFTVIEKGTFDGTTSGIDFTSIPASYAHLEMSVTFNSTGTGYREWIHLTINGDTGSNYAYLGVGNASAGYGTLETQQTSSTSGPMIIGAGTGSAAGSGSGGDMVASFNMWMWNYADTTFHKTYYANSGYASGGAWMNVQRGGLWRSTAAINQVKLNVTDTSSEKNKAGCQYMLAGWT